MDASNAIVIFEADNGHHYAYPMGNTEDGYLPILHDYSIVTKYIEFFDNSGVGYPTPSEEDELWIMGSTDVVVDSQMTAEAVGRAITWSSGAHFYPAVLPLEEGGTLFHGYFAGDLFAEGVDGEVLAATSMGEPIGDFDDGSLVSAVVTTPGEMILDITSATQYRILVPHP
jgi:hypothetical protein